LANEVVQYTKTKTYLVLFILTAFTFICTETKRKINLLKFEHHIKPSLRCSQEITRKKPAIGSVYDAGQQNQDLFPKTIQSLKRLPETGEKIHSRIF